MEKLSEDLNQRIVVAEVLVNCLQGSLSGTGSGTRILDLFRESVVERMRIEYLRGSLEKGFRDLEGQEKKFEGENVALKEEEFILTSEGLLKMIKARAEEVDEELKLVRENSDWLKVARREVEEIRRRACEKLKEIDSREQNLKTAEELLVVKEREVDDRLKSVEEREKEIEGKVLDLVLKKKELLGSDLVENKLEGAKAVIDHRLKEIGFHGDLACDSAIASIVEAESIRESLDKQLTDFGKSEMELNPYQAEKSQELVSVELIKHVNKQLAERQKLGLQLVKKLRLAGNYLKELHEVAIDLQRRKEELDLKEKNLGTWEKELEVKEVDVGSALESIKQRPGNLDWGEKNSHSAVEKQTCQDKELVEEHTRAFECRKEELENWARELQSREKQIEYQFKELELRQQELSDFHNFPVKFEPDDSADLIFTLRMNGKSVQMFLNDPNKDLESMGDETFEVLHKSSDPAKLVLDAMEGFHPPHLRKGDMELNVQNTCIHLLEQLIKMSPEIRPCTREAAVELAREWRSKMSTTTENQLEILGFLHLLAAYELASYFDKNELLNFLKMVSGHRQTPELCRSLGFTERTSDNMVNAVDSSPTSGVTSCNTLRQFDGPLSSGPKLHENVKILITSDLPLHHSPCKTHLDVVDLRDFVPRDIGLTLNNVNKCSSIEDPSLCSIDNHRTPTRNDQNLQGTNNLKRKRSVLGDSTLPYCALHELTKESSVEETMKVEESVHLAQSPVVGNKGKGKKRRKCKGKSNASVDKKAKPQNGNCFYCGEVGHWKRNCRMYLDSLPTKPGKASAQGIPANHVGWSYVPYVW